MQISFSRAFPFMLAGPIIWAGHYLFVYAINGIACARPALYSTWMDVPVSSWIIIAVSLLALAAMTLIHLRLRAPMRDTANGAFLPWLAGALTLLSGVAVIWETMPVLLVPACG